jgi:AraC-like DNA-binding protein
VGRRAHGRTADISGPNLTTESFEKGSAIATGEPGWRTEVVVAADADRLAIGIPGMDGAITRTGTGQGPCAVVMRERDGLAMGSVDIRFPIVGWAEVGDDVVVLGVVERVAQGAKWNGEELDIGDVIVLPPGSFHEAVEPEGLRYEMIVADIGLLESVAADLELRLDPEEGLLEPEDARRITHPHHASARGGDKDALLSAIASALSETSDGVRARPYRRISSREVTRRVSEHLEATGTWMPSSLEMCRAATVSERRLQQAFHDVYDMPPSVYLRQRALSSVHEFFQSVDPHDIRIADAARDFGFEHPSRFALYYRNSFGETPSETLARPDSSG